MGFRFRKSVKICKGVRVNFSKSGTSLSLGGKGHSTNFSNRGTRVTVGVPGTGLSYSSLLSSPSKSQRNSSDYRTRTSPTISLPSQVGIQMNDRGKVTLIDESGNEITNAAIIRKIKATPQYAAQVANLDRQRIKNIEEYYANSMAENERFINIYRLAPRVNSVADFTSLLQKIIPEQYEEKKFEIPAPTEESIKSLLVSEAEQTVNGSIFTVRKLRKKYVADNLESKYANAIAAWESERDNFLALEAENRREFEALAQEDCNNQKAFLQALIDGNGDAICKELDAWITSCELPIEMSVNYEWVSESDALFLDVDLPEIEDLPTKKVTKTDVGNLKEKNKTQTELRAEYATLVFGLAIFIASNAFGISPAIKNSLISGYTQRRDKEGNLADDYIYSIKFRRDSFEHKSFKRINPKDFCLAAENRCNLTSTSLFRKIVPFDNV